MFTAALFTIARHGKGLNVHQQTNGIKKMQCTHTHTHAHNGILFSHKEEWNNATGSNMNAPRDYHTKRSRSERERQMYDIIKCGIKDMTHMNTSMKQK